jgi:broad-specificity NMP kinase
MVKIAFSGVPRCGKTSILAEVKKILALKFRVADVEDLTARNPFDVERKAGFVSQFFYMTTQINEENVRSQELADALLCDRSVLDQWVYWRKYLAEQEATALRRDEDALLEHVCGFWAKTYDLIVHVRVDPRVLQQRIDPREARVADPAGVRVLEELLLKSFRDERLRTLEVWNHQTVDECAHRVIREIQDLALL